MTTALALVLFQFLRSFSGLGRPKFDQKRTKTKLVIASRLRSRLELYSRPARSDCQLPLLPHGEAEEAIPHADDNSALTQFSNLAIPVTYSSIWS